MTIKPISFPLDQEHNEAVLIYRPWGIKTLKINVTVTKEKEGDFPALRLRPQHIPDLRVPGVRCGYADNSDAFLISWGGGHDLGPCLKADDEGHVEGCIALTADATSNIYLNVQHRGPEAPEAATITLEAYDEKDNDKVYARLTITLQKPDIASDSIMRLVRQNGEWRIGNGRSLPSYDPRWQPKSDVTYQSVTELPLSIRQEELKLHVYWQDQTRIITIDDQTRPSMLDKKTDPALIEPGGIAFELFNWNDDFVALRIWFIWLNTKIPKRYKTLNHEVPDAERFDFLIRKKNGKVALACTDLHWREMWGRMREMPVNGEVGLTAGTVFKLGVEHVLGKKLQDLLPETLVTGKKLPYDLLLGFVEREADDFVLQDDEGARVELAPGLEAHVPTFDDSVGLDAALVSRDVRYE